jgi:hypothetical protein
VVLEAGDAIYIQRGWWHCFLAEAGGVAIPIEIVSKAKGSGVGGIAPKVYRHVGTRHNSGRSARKVARRVGWCSAASVRELWTPALAAYEFGRPGLPAAAARARMG